MAMGLRCQYIDGLMQEWRISNANTLRLGFVFLHQPIDIFPRIIHSVRAMGLLPDT